MKYDRNYIIQSLLCPVSTICGDRHEVYQTIRNDEDAREAFLKEERILTYKYLCPYDDECSDDIITKYRIDQLLLNTICEEAFSRYLKYNCNADYNCYNDVTMCNQKKSLVTFDPVDFTVWSENYHFCITKSTKMSNWWTSSPHRKEIYNTCDYIIFLGGASFSTKDRILTIDTITIAERNDKNYYNTIPSPNLTTGINRHLKHICESYGIFYGGCEGCKSALA